MLFSPPEACSKIVDLVKARSFTDFSEDISGIYARSAMCKTADGDVISTSCPDDAKWSQDAASLTKYRNDPFTDDSSNQVSGTRWETARGANATKRCEILCLTYVYLAGVPWL